MLNQKKLQKITSTRVHSPSFFFQKIIKITCDFQKERRKITTKGSVYGGS